MVWVCTAANLVQRLVSTWNNVKAIVTYTGLSAGIQPLGNSFVVGACSPEDLLGTPKSTTVGFEGLSPGVYPCRRAKCGGQILPACSWHTTQLIWCESHSEQGMLWGHQHEMYYKGQSLLQIGHFSAIKKCGGWQVSCFVEQPHNQHIHPLFWIYCILKFIIVNKSTDKFVEFVLVYCVHLKDFEMKKKYDKNRHKGYKNILVLGQMHSLQCNMKMQIFHMHAAQACVCTLGAWRRCTHTVRARK